MLAFDWDDANRRHIALHSVSPEEAEEALLNDPLELSYEIVDGEERIAELGRTNTGRILAVASTWRNGQVRVITAYDAVKKMKDQYILEKGYPQ
jgi:uncharacterized DUF497 family protein